MRALADAADAHPRATCRLLTLTRGAGPRVKMPDVVVQPAYEWMLTRPT